MRHFSPLLLFSAITAETAPFAEVFTGSEFLEGSSSAWWSDVWSTELYNLVVAGTSDIFEMYFTGSDSSKDAKALDKAKANIFRQVSDFENDMITRRDKCIGENEKPEVNF